MHAAPVFKALDGVTAVVKIESTQTPTILVGVSVTSLAGGSDACVLGQPRGRTPSVFEKKIKTSRASEASEAAAQPPPNERSE
jgi:hypothetical protein